MNFIFAYNRINFNIFCVRREGCTIFKKGNLKKVNIKEINHKSGLNQMFISLVCLPLIWALRIILKNEGKDVWNVSFTPQKRLCCLKSEHLFIVIMYKTCICHSLEILFELQHLLLGEGTKVRSKEVNFQYKKGGKKEKKWGLFLKCFSSSKCFWFHKGHF